jgi:hypothetical protein
MSPLEVTPAPDISSAAKHNGKWEREHQAFRQMLPTLLATHANKFVAIHSGEVVCVGEDQAKVALAAYTKYGYVPIFVGLVSTNQPAMRVPSPRLHSDGVK